MRQSFVPGSVAALVLLVGSAFAADDFKSGPQKPVMKIRAFNPTHCSGPGIGKKSCPVIANGANPVAMIFARNLSDGLTSLVKKIDEATVKNARAEMGSFVVVCNDDEKVAGRLTELARKEGLRKTILTTVDRRAGPPGYALEPKADITVVLYRKHSTKAQFAYAKGELKASDVDDVIAALAKILPEK